MGNGPSTRMQLNDPLGIGGDCILYVGEMQPLLS